MLVCFNFWFDVQLLLFFFKKNLLKKCTYQLLNPVLILSFSIFPLPVIQDMPVINAKQWRAVLPHNLPPLRTCAGTPTCARFSDNAEGRWLPSPIPMLTAYRTWTNERDLATHAFSSSLFYPACIQCIHCSVQELVHLKIRSPVNIK